MPPVAAASIFLTGILGLFVLDRNEVTQGSKVLWIPTAWFFFCLSRSFSLWVGLGSVETAAQQASVYMNGNPVDRVVYISIEVMALLVVISRRQRVYAILTSNWAIDLFFLYAGFSILWSDYPLVTFRHWIKGVGDLMMVLIILSEPDIPAAVRSMVTRLGFVLLPLSLLFIRYFPDIGRVYIPGGLPQAVGVTSQKNGLGELCDCIGLGLLWCFRDAYSRQKSRGRRGRLIALGTVLAIVVWLLWMCNSMTSIAALSMASSVMFLSARPAFRRKPAALHLLVAGVLGLSIYALFLQNSGSLVGELGRDPSLTGRTEIWKLVLSMPANRLVGTGYESFWVGPRLQKVWDTFQGIRIMEAHNGYVEILITLGWIGIVLLGLLIMIGYRNVIRDYRHNPDVGSLRIAWFLAALITAFTEAAFRMECPCWLVFLLAATAAPWSGSVSRRIRVRPAGASQAHLNVAEGDHVIADVKSKVQTVI